MKEHDLLNACLQKDRQAQKQLYDQYKDAMYTTIYRLVGDYDSANDVLQESFIKVFKNLEKFRKESTIGAWIKTICVRTAYDKLRKKNYLTPLEDHHHEHAVVDWGSSIDSDYLEQAINKLPQGYKNVFLMIEVEGYKHREVADIMNVSIGTTKSQLFSAKRKLREYLDPYIK